MAFASMGMPGSPFAALLSHLGLPQPSPLIPNPSVPIDVRNGFRSPGPPVPIDVSNGFRVPIGSFGPSDGGIATLPAPAQSGLPLPAPSQAGLPLPAPAPPGYTGGAIQPTQPGLPSPPSLGLFPHPDPSTAVAQIHQVVGHHHNVLQALLAAIHGLANAPVGVDAHGHTQAGFHSQSTHNATVARRQGNNHPLPLQ